MTISIDQLIQGFGQTRTVSPLKDNLAIGLYGVGGSGKSLELNIALQNALVVKTGSTVTRPYYSWQREQNRPVFDRAVHDFKAANSSQTAHPLFEAYGDQHGSNAVEQLTGWRGLLTELDIPPGPMPGVSHYWSWIEALRAQLIGARQQGVAVHDNNGRVIDSIVFDEFNHVMYYVYKEMLQGNYFPPKKITGTIFDEMPTMNAFDEWLTGFVFEFRQHGIGLGLVCQEAALTYDEDKNSKFYGQLKYKIGPVTPFGRLRAKLTQIVDIMWRITLEAGNISAPMAVALPGATLAPANGVGALPGVVGVSAPLAGVVAGVVGSVLPNAANGVALSSNALDRFRIETVVGSSTWPLPAKPLKGWSKRKFWTEARPDVEAKTRDVVIPHQVDLGLRAQLELAGFSI